VALFVSYPSRVSGGACTLLLNDRLGRRTVPPCARPRERGPNETGRLRRAVIRPFLPRRRAPGQVPKMRCGLNRDWAFCGGSSHCPIRVGNPRTINGTIAGDPSILSRAMPPASNRGRTRPIPRRARLPEEGSRRQEERKKSGFGRVDLRPFLRETPATATDSPKWFGGRPAPPVAGFQPERVRPEPSKPRDMALAGGQPLPLLPARDGRSEVSAPTPFRPGARRTAPCLCSSIIKPRRGTVRAFSPLEEPPALSCPPPRRSAARPGR